MDGFIILTQENGTKIAVKADEVVTVTTQSDDLDGGSVVRILNERTFTESVLTVKDTIHAIVKRINEILGA